MLWCWGGQVENIICFPEGFRLNPEREVGAGGGHHRPQGRAGSGPCVCVYVCTCVRVPPSGDLAEREL